MSFESESAPGDRRGVTGVPFVDAELELAAIVESSDDASIARRSASPAAPATAA